MILPKSFFSLVNHFGLLITSTSVRIIELQKDNSVKTKAALVSQEPIITGDTVNEAVLASLVNEARKQAGCSAEFAAVCIPEKIAYSREHVLPKIPLAEVQEAISWQIGSIFPFSPEDIYFDWKLIEQQPDKTKVVVVAVAKKIVDGIKSSLATINVRPLSFEPSASVLSRSLVSSINTDHIVMEIDSFGTSSTLIKNKVAVLTTTTHFQASADPQQTFDSIATSVHNMIAHVYQDQVPTDLKIFITGEKASDKIAELLAQTLQKTVQLLPLQATEPAFHLAYAAALSAILPPQSEQSINVLPLVLQQEYQIEVETIQAKKTFVLSLIPSVLALVIALSLLGVTTFNKSLVSQPGTAPPTSAGSNGISIPLILQKAQKISRLKAAKAVPTVVLNTIIDAQDETISINHLNVDVVKKSVELSVKGKDREAFVKFKNKLESSGIVTNVTIPLAALAAESVQDIKISMQYKEQVAQ